VLDFGLAYALGHRKLDGGTPDWMAPEQGRGAPEDERTDVHALGVLLFRLLADRLPAPEEGAAPALECPAAPSLGALVARMLAQRGANVPADDRLARMCALFKDRCATLIELADWLGMYFVDVSPSEADLSAHVTDVVRPALQSLRGRLAEIDWDKGTIATTIKEILTAHGLKMPQLAHALRVLVCGRTQTPSIDAVLELFPRDVVLRRLQGV